MQTQTTLPARLQQLARHEMVGQFVRYAVIGVFNVCVHLTLFNLFFFLGLKALVANAVAFFFASINSFVLNKAWAFRDRDRGALVRQYLVFLFFTLIGLGLHTGAFALLLKPLHPHGTLGKNIALLAALPVSVVWNFTCYRLWTFNPTAGGERPTPDPGSAAA